MKNVNLRNLSLMCDFASFMEAIRYLIAKTSTYAKKKKNAKKKNTECYFTPDYYTTAYLINATRGG